MVLLQGKIQYEGKGFKEKRKKSKFIIKGNKILQIVLFSDIKKASCDAFLHILILAQNYLLLRAPKRLLNLSTRPPVSAAFCLPV